MHKLLALITILLCAPAYLGAQTQVAPETRHGASLQATSLSSQPSALSSWSLDSCITYALEHNLTVRSAMIEQMGSDLGVTEAKDRFLPTLQAGAQQSWDFGRSLTADNTYANRNTSMFGFNAQLSLPLFQGLSAVRQLRQAREQLEASRLQILSVKDEVTLSVISYYLQALYNQELLAVSQEQLRLSQTQLERQQALFEAGKVPEVDVIQARAQVAQAEVDVVTADNNLSLSVVDLAQALELHDREGFGVCPLDDQILMWIESPEVVKEHALANYPSILAARANISVADRGIDVAKTGYLPKLYFNAGLSDNYYKMSGIPNSSFSHQMRDNFAKSLGFTLQVPIFDAFSTRNSVRRARVSRLSALLELDRRESELTKAIDQAYTQAVGARKKYEASQTAVDAAKAALDAMTEKYTYGKANATEWEQTRSNYITTLSQQVQAKYEAILRHKILAFYDRH